MAVRPDQRESSPPCVTPEVGIDLLQRLAAEGDRLLSKRPITELDKKLWEDKAWDYFLRAFGPESRSLNPVLGAGRREFTRGHDEAYYENLRFEELRDEVRRVGWLIDQLQLEIDSNASCLTCGQLYREGKDKFCPGCGTPLVDPGEYHETIWANDPDGL
ncbi:MAG: hypothetical protein ACJ73D_06475 [Pyrinomonadaceae bacterium]